MHPSENNLSFEEQAILQKRGLAPNEGDNQSPLPMAEVNKINEIAVLRKKVISFAVGKTVKELDASGLTLEFGKVLGDFQKTLETTHSGEPEDPEVIMIETSNIFSELGWYDECFDEVGTAIELATNLEKDTESLFGLLGEALILEPGNRELFSNWKKQFGEDLTPADFANEIFETGLSQSNEDMSFHEQLELGSLILSSSIES